jgi:pimeloyl-ACP methyl ester carboxylesterase
MLVPTLLIAIALVAISLVASFVTLSGRKTAAARFAKRFGLEVPDGFEPTIRAGVEARRVGAPIGTGISVAIATVLILLTPNLSLLATWWCLFGAYLVGASLGSTAATLIAEQRRDRGAVRVARINAVSVGDYVSLLQTNLVRIFVALAVLAFAADGWLAISVSPRYLSVVSGVIAGLAVVTLGVYEVVSRQLVARGALAGTSAELAWDDGLRSYALTNLSGTVGLLPLYSLIAYDTLLINSAGIGSNPLFPVFTGFAPIAATVGILALVVLMTRVRTRQYFLRRLWPELASKVDDNLAGVYTSIVGGR